MSEIVKQAREVKKWHLDQKIQRTLSQLKKNGFKTFYASTGSEALEKVLSLIPSKATVGIGGSITIRQIKLIEALTARGNTIFQHWQQPAGKGEEMELKQLTSDVFLASSNAITEDGKLVNIDMGGNRVGAMVFGPKQIILVAGFNKIVKDVEAGIDRARNVAASMNARRLYTNSGQTKYKTPCAITGVCTDCDAEDRLCRVISIVERKPSGSHVSIIVVGDELGF